MCKRIAKKWYNKSERSFFFQFVIPIYIVISILLDKLHVIKENTNIYTFYIIITLLYALFKIYIDYFMNTLNENYVRKYTKIKWINICLFKF